jgi:hypothetical protein
VHVRAAADEQSVVYSSESPGSKPTWSLDSANTIARVPIIPNAETSLHGRRRGAAAATLGGVRGCFLPSVYAGMLRRSLELH